MIGLHVLAVCIRRKQARVIFTLGFFLFRLPFLYYLFHRPVNFFSRHVYRLPFIIIIIIALIRRFSADYIALYRCLCATYLKNIRLIMFIHIVYFFLQSFHLTIVKYCRMDFVYNKPIVL